MRYIETLSHQEIEELMRSMYVDEGLKRDEIGEEINVSPPIIGKWLRKAGIYGRRLGIVEKYNLMKGDENEIYNNR